MAFNGTLLKLGGEVFPMRWIEYDTYKVVPNRRQDLNPFRNANGVLQRNVVAHEPTTIDFSLRSMYNKDIASVMSFIRSKYTNVKEKKLIIQYYDPEYDNYNDGSFYLDPNVEFPIKTINIEKKVIKYGQIKLSFVGY